MLTGLTDEQVNERIEQGKVNADENPNTRTYKQIVRENTLTFFNFLNLVLLILVLMVGSYKNAFFVGIIIINTLIGIAQEIRAKKTIDKLAILVEMEKELKLRLKTCWHRLFVMSMTIQREKFLLIKLFLVLWSMWSLKNKDFVEK